MASPTQTIPLNAFAQENRRDNLKPLVMLVSCSRLNWNRIVRCKTSGAGMGPVRPLVSIVWPQPYSARNILSRSALLRGLEIRRRTLQCEKSSLWLVMFTCPYIVCCYRSLLGYGGKTFIRIAVAWAACMPKTVSVRLFYLFCSACFLWQCIRHPSNYVASQTRSRWTFAGYMARFLRQGGRQAN